MKNIFLIPTPNESRLYKGDNGLIAFGLIKTSTQSRNDYFTNQNIYITSDEKFVRDEYITDGIEVIKASPKLVNAQGLVDRRNWKKIIITNDLELIKDGIQEIDDEFLEWFVKNPSCDLVLVRDKPKVKAVVKGLGIKNFNNGYKIILPKDEQKQHLIDMMKGDEELGLYDESREIKIEDIFNDEKREGVKKLIELHKKYEHTYTNKEIRTWWLNQTEERRRDMVREYFKGGNSENINTLYGIMPEEMEEMYNINVDVVIMDWEEILFDFIDFYPCQLPHELFEWLEENYEIPKKKNGK